MYRFYTLVVSSFSSQTILLEHDLSLRCWGMGGSASNQNKRSVGWLNPNHEHPTILGNMSMCCG